MNTKPTHVTRRTRLRGEGGAWKALTRPSRSRGPGGPTVRATFGGILLWLALSSGGQAAVVPDRLLVQTDREMPEAAVANLLRTHGTRQEWVLPQIGVRLVRVPEAHREAARDTLARTPGVIFAEEDAIIGPDGVPNDPAYGSQWHLPKISAPLAWDITTGSSAVTVAILDTGVDGTHPDLSLLMVPGWNFYNNNNDTRDVTGHGTSVAGSAVAVGNNGIGIASVAWNCGIMPVRISAPDGTSTYSVVATALLWAADHGARVANISFSGVARSATVQSAARYLQSKGGVTTASAGNDGVYIEAPDSPDLLAVGATDSSDRLASFSARGPFVDLTAPGVGVYTTARGGGYRSVSGTSFSAPIVAGAAALVISRNPGLSALEVQDLLTGSADDLGSPGYDPGFGHGRVNAYGAVFAAGSYEPGYTIPPTVAITSPEHGSTVSGTVSVQVVAADDTALARVELRLDGATVTEAPNGEFVFLWDTTRQSDGTHTLTAVAYDEAGNQASTSVTVSVDNVQDPPPPTDTTPPAAVITSPTSGAQLKQVQKITVIASDNVGVVRVELYHSGSVLIGSSAGNSKGSYSFNWNAGKLPRGSYTLVAKAYDAAGNTGNSPGVTVSK